jgi:hypothetical protein
MLFFYAPAFPEPFPISDSVSALPSIASQLDGFFWLFRIFFFGAALFLIVGVVAAIVGGKIEEAAE